MVCCWGAIGGRGVPQEELGMALDGLNYANERVCNAVGPKFKGNSDAA